MFIDMLPEVLIN